MKFKTVSVIGLGYIGLPTAAMFASKKRKVIGVDINEKTIEIINSGKIHITEPGLEAVVSDVVQKGFLSAINRPEKADAFVIAVPTPVKGGENEPDLSFVKEAVQQIAPVLEKGNLVVLESTSPVGTTEKISQWLSDLRPDLIFPKVGGSPGDVGLSYCPERVLPGNIIKELVSNDRVIGGITKKCGTDTEELFRCFVKGDIHLANNVKVAEMVKLTENASRDVAIAFANEIHLVCDEHKINPWELISLANRHPRVNILKPGPGVGGHCIAVDPWFIINNSKHNTELMRLARKINDAKPEWVAEKIKHYIAQNDVQHIVLFGASYKADVDDLRESPSIKIATSFLKGIGKKVLIVEPNIKSTNIQGIQTINIDDIDFQNDLCVMLVTHSHFLNLAKPKHLIDVVGLYDQE